MNFSKQKNGYNELEVNKHIELLVASHKAEIEKKDEIIKALKEEVKAVKSKEKSIGLALTAAVDKAKEIEESSQKIYKLKLEQLGMIYTKWEILLNEFLKKNPNIKDVSNIKQDMEQLKTSIKTALKDDFNIELITKTPVTDPIRFLLNRLTETKSSIKQTSETQPKVIKRKAPTNQKTELEKIEEKTNQIKPISTLTLEKEDKFENLVDKFLVSDDEVPESFAKVLQVPAFSKSESKFDLSEAINPKEDLEEIMKSFDFYTGN